MTLPLAGAVLVGGGSRRMGRPKALLGWRGRYLLGAVADTLAVTLGSPPVLVGGGFLPPGPWPRLGDLDGGRGPAAGIAALLRARPDRAWLVAAVDLPGLEAAALEWLGDRRDERRLGVVPTLPAGPQPQLAIWEPSAGALMVEAARAGRGPRRLVAERAEDFAMPELPAELEPAWRGVNDPAQWRRWRRSGKD